MRTMITLEPDIHQLIQELMQAEGLSFKQAVKQAVRKALAGRRAAAAFRQKTVRMGTSKSDLTKALALADELDDTHKTGTAS